MASLRIWYINKNDLDPSTDRDRVFPRHTYFQAITIPAFPSKVESGLSSDSLARVSSDVDAFIDLERAPDADREQALFLQANQSYWFEFEGHDKISVKAAATASGIVTSVSDSQTGPALASVTIPAPVAGLYNEITAIYPTIAGAIGATVAAGVEVVQDAVDTIYEAVLTAPIVPEIAAPVLAPLKIAVDEALEAVVSITTPATLPDNSLTVSYITKSIRSR